MDLGKVIGSTIVTFVVWVVCQSCYDAMTAKHHTKVPEPPRAEAPKPEAPKACDVQRTIEAKAEVPQPKPEPPKPTKPRPKPQPKAPPKPEPKLIDASELQKIIPELNHAAMGRVGDEGRYTNIPNYAVLRLHNPTDYYVYFKVQVTLKNGLVRTYDVLETCSPRSDCKGWLGTDIDGDWASWYIAGVYVIAKEEKTLGYQRGKYFSRDIIIQGNF